MTSQFNPQTSIAAAGTQERPRRTLSANTLKGDKVVNAAGEDLGKIAELMIDLGSGKVAYAVLSFGGFLGIADKLFAVPWDALQLDQESHAFMLDVAKESLENAPGFPKDAWPDMDSPAWRTQIHEYYGLADFD